jgi:hypothetical protein
MRVAVRFASALLVLAAGCSAGGSGDDTPLDMTVPPDLSTLNPGVVSMSPKSLSEAETSIAVAANGYLAVAYIGITQLGSNNGYRFSTDQGDTFVAADALDAYKPGAETSDPVLATDAQNNFYLSWVEFMRDAQGNPFDMHVYVARAMAGTTSFTDVAEVTSNPQGIDAYDKPWIMVTNDGALLVTYARVSTGGIFAARSTDFNTWTSATIIDDKMSFRNLVFPCQPAGAMKLYVAYNAIGGIGLRWSDDAGMTWDSTKATPVADTGEMSAFDDPTCVADGQEVWVSYGLSNDNIMGGGTAAPKLFAIRIAHSSDSGVTIDNRYDAHDTAAGALYQHPYLVREPSGVLDLTYYAGNQEGDTAGSYRLARSMDGGKTWPASTAIKAPITFTARRDTGAWLGDYEGLAFSGGTLYMSYVDNSRVTSHTAFYRTTPSP